MQFEEWAGFVYFPRLEIDKAKTKEWHPSIQEEMLKEAEE